MLVAFSRLTSDDFASLRADLDTPNNAFAVPEAMHRNFDRFQVIYEATVRSSLRCYDVSNRGSTGSRQHLPRHHQRLRLSDPARADSIRPREHKLATPVDLTPGNHSIKQPPRPLYFALHAAAARIIRTAGVADVDQLETPDDERRHLLPAKGGRMAEDVWREAFLGGHLVWA